MSELEPFGEPVTTDFAHVFQGRLLHREQSPYQKIEVYEHAHFGRMLIIDDVVQTTERDEYCYHEMLVHPVLSCFDHVGRVLVIGGGDGGTLRHVLMHNPGEVHMCEIDEAVVRVSREHLPALSAGAFDDDRAHVIYEDGFAFVARYDDHFDAIIVDSTDPVGPAVVLFGEDFYRACRRALRRGGLLVAQSGSPIYQEEEFKMAVGNMSKAFEHVEVYQGFVPTYPGVFWSFTVGVTGDRPSDQEVGWRLDARSIRTRFYSAEKHRAAFALPVFVRGFVEEARAAAASGADPGE